TFCGLGNISATIIDEASSRSMVSHNGTAGYEAPRIAQFEYDLRRGFLLILHTDGISAKWNLQSYPGLSLRHPATIAGVLYRDFRRQRDDVTVLVARETGEFSGRGGA